MVCRAKDLSGNEDQNTLVRVATTPIDTMPPTFNGATSVDMIGTTSVEINWSTPATDSQTASNQIVYLVYQSMQSGGEFPVTDGGVGDGGAMATPVATSTPGASSITITNLQPATTYYWVVRAENRGSLIDSNTAEVYATTLVSFSQDVTLVLGTHCAVTGCHVPGTAPNGLIMTPSQAYSHLVDVPVVEDPAFLRVDPGKASDSYIILKVSATSMNPPPFGTQMPPPSTGDSLSATEIATIRNWINQGALQN
jgi:hypothetical protein